MHAAGAEDVVVAMHRRLFLETARVRTWVGPGGFPWRLLPAPVGHEWLELVRSTGRVAAPPGPGSWPTPAGPTWP